VAAQNDHGAEQRDLSIAMPPALARCAVSNLQQPIIFALEIWSHARKRHDRR
jgi:hypothetical protein